MITQDEFTILHCRDLSKELIEKTNNDHLLILIHDDTDEVYHTVRECKKHKCDLTYVIMLMQSSDMTFEELCNGYSKFLMSEENFPWNASANPIRIFEINEGRKRHEAL